MSELNGTWRRVDGTWRVVVKAQTLPHPGTKICVKRRDGTCSIEVVYSAWAKGDGEWVCEIVVGASTPAKVERKASAPKQARAPKTTKPATATISWWRLRSEKSEAQGQVVKSVQSPTGHVRILWATNRWVSESAVEDMGERLPQGCIRGCYLVEFAGEPCEGAV